MVFAAQVHTAAKNTAAGKAVFTLASPDIVDGRIIAEKQVFNPFGRPNVSPALSWRNAPSGTKSFALLVYDPDASTGSGWWHWVVYDIPADVTSLPADAGDPKKNLMPAAAVQGRNDYGTPEHDRPCPPPDRPHHYYFRWYALNVPKLAVPAEATAALTGFNVKANSLGVTQILGMYGR